MHSHIFIACALTAFIIHPAIGWGQSNEIKIDEAIQLYQADNPTEASRQFHTILTSADVNRLSSETQAKAYTYLAMSEWALYRRSEAMAAVTAAIRTDAKAFVLYGSNWAKKNSTITDSVVTDIMNQALLFYDDAEFASSASELTLLLSIEEIIEMETAAEIHKLLAFCYIAMRKSKLAQQEFRMALRFNPQLDLGDDAVVAPKIRRSFLSVRRDALRLSQQSIRRNTILRSILVPGWGQHYRGAHKKGYLFMATEVSLLTGMFVSLRSYGKARDAYENFGADEALAIYNQQNSIDDVRSELDTRFDRFQSKSTQVNTLIAFAVGVWAINMVDVLISSLRHDFLYADRTPASSTRGFAMDWDSANRQWGVKYGLKW